jgi:hypothetical protein
MSIAIESSFVTTIDQIAAASAVNHYVHQSLGTTFKAGKGRQLNNGDWHFLVLCHAPELKRPWTCAVVHVDGQNGNVTPLTTEQLQEVRERAAVAVADARGQQPIINGVVSRLFARRRANLYLNEVVGFFLTPTDGALIPLDPPVWQFPIQLHLPRSGDLGILGTIDVNAQTSDVVPLPAAQIAEIQRRANALARSQA